MVSGTLFRGALVCRVAKREVNSGMSPFPKGLCVFMIHFFPARGFPGNSEGSGGIFTVVCVNPASVECVPDKEGAGQRDKG